MLDMFRRRASAANIYSFSVDHKEIAESKTNPSEQGDIKY